MKTTYQPMRVEGTKAHPLIEPIKDHGRALAVAVSVARYPLDKPLEGVRYVVYRDGKVCECAVCLVFAKERLFEPNVCRSCTMELERPGHSAENVEASKAHAERRAVRRVKIVYEPF
jgi:hypothetical protein